MKWFNIIRWGLEIYLLSLPLMLFFQHLSGPYSQHILGLDESSRQIIGVIIILIILIRIVILFSKIILIWLNSDQLKRFNDKTHKLAIIAVIGYTLCILPDLLISINWYHYTNLYLVRVIVYPLPIILGLVDVFILKNKPPFYAQ